MKEQVKYEVNFDELMKSVNDEFALFYNAELKKSKDEIFDDCEKIRFYKSIYDYISHVFGDFSRKEHYNGMILALLKDPYGLIDRLYDFYSFHLPKKGYRINTYDDIDEIIADYVTALIRESSPFIF